MRFETAAVQAGFASELAASSGTTSEPAPLAEQEKLEHALMALEGGRCARIFPDCTALLATVFGSFSHQDHVLISRDISQPFREFLARAPFAYEFIDQTKPTLVEDSFRPNTRILWLETPSDPFLRIADIHSLAKLGAAKGVRTYVDSTTASPVLQRPIDLGASAVIHTSGRFLSGQAEVGLAAIVSIRETPPPGEEARVDLPHEQLLALSRGLQTLSIRVERHCATAEIVADYLNEHPRVEKVHYPGLPCHVGIAVASRQMSNWGSLVSFRVRGGAREVAQVADSLQLVNRCPVTGIAQSTIMLATELGLPTAEIPANLLRLSVGLEHSDDLCEDLGAALATLD